MFSWVTYASSIIDPDKTAFIPGFGTGIYSHAVKDGGEGSSDAWFIKLKRRAHRFVTTTPG